MNRRDILKRLAALPVIGAIVPAALAAPRDFDTATATVRMIYDAPLLPGPWKYMSTRLHDADLQGHTMEGDFPLEALRYEHVWKPAVDICQRCGVTCEEIEDGRATKFCHGPVEDVYLYGFGEPR